MEFRGEELKELRLKIKADYEFLTTTDLAEILRCVRTPFTREYRWRRDVLHIEVIETKKSLLIDILVVAPLSYLIGKAIEKGIEGLRRKIKKNLEESGVHRRENIYHISIAIFVNGRKMVKIELPEGEF